MADDVEKILLTRDEIAEKVRELGAQISADFEGEEVIVACVLRGAFVFCADLVRALTVPATIEFLSASSYGKASVSSGNVQIKSDFEVDIHDKNVLLVEDIMDSGLTLNRLKEMLQVRQPRSLKIVALLDKPERRRVDLQADYIGFTIPDEFVVGYGLDYASQYRQLPDIGVLKPEIYTA
ncbi:MAG: hypoxanthine phosphoribosyltransferase [Clostridia bacterium]|nr:hypoxanthine phosphoribosyltransferase [Clostridia bacterium]MBQ9988472.1 hypoxanthine phosphoribosyltransferase [Clostridia bacterium]